MSDLVRLSAHARGRWIERSDRPLVDHLSAWYEAVEVPPCELDADRVRLDGAARVPVVPIPGGSGRPFGPLAPVGLVARRPQDRSRRRPPTRP